MLTLILDVLQSEGESFGVESPAFVAVRWAQYLAFAVYAGAVLAHAASFARGVTARPLAGIVAVLRPRQLRWMLWSLLALALTALLRMYAQVHAFDDTTYFMNPDTVHALLSGTVWGTAWIVEVVALALGFGATRLLGSNAVGARALSVVPLIAIAVSFALSGHAASAEGSTLIPVLVDSIHVVSAGVWLGGLIVVISLAASSARALPPVDRLTALSALVRAFSPIAIGAVAAILVTGGIGSWLRLGTLSALFESAYGRTLIIKVIAVCAMLFAGLVNWRWVTPRLIRDEPASEAALKRAVTVEFALGVFVLLVTAVLVATTPPSEG